MTTRQKYIAQGLCQNCGKNQPEKPSKTCVDCKQKQKEYKANLKQHCLDNSLCQQCVKAQVVPGRHYCKTCIKYRREASRKNYKKGYHKDYRQQVRKQVIEKYGGQCECCKEKELAFLAIDHKNNDGNIERTKLYGKNEGRSNSWYLKLKREERREDLRVLCHNCNIAIAFYGSCPHGKADPGS